MAIMGLNQSKPITPVTPSPRPTLIPTNPPPPTLEPTLEPTPIIEEIDVMEVTELEESNLLDELTENSTASDASNLDF
jgi:hypothetical protein